MQKRIRGRVLIIDYIEREGSGAFCKVQINKHLVNTLSGMFSTLHNAPDPYFSTYTAPVGSHPFQRVLPCNVPEKHARLDYALD